jgi:hypothetical protein
MIQVFVALHHGPEVYSAPNRNENKTFLGVKRPVCTAGNLTAIYRLTVYTMWDLHHLTSLQASVACYRDRYTFTSV